MTVLQTRVLSIRELGPDFGRHAGIAEYQPGEGMPQVQFRLFCEINWTLDLSGSEFIHPALKVSY